MMKIKQKMMRWSLLLVFISALAGLVKAQTPVWEENFDGTTINRNVWTYDVSGSGMGNGELQYYTDRAANSYISNGNLVIEAKRENYEGKQFTSARLKTLGRFSFQYGIVEARIKLPNLANGLWPAFWTMGENFGPAGWPKCGEIDILEAGSEEARLSGKINSMMSGALHWWHETGTWSTWLQADAAASATLPSGNFYDGYHIYKMVWDSTHIEFWLDNNKFFDMDISAPELSEFRQPHFFILNLAVGGTNYLNLPDPSQITAPLPAKMEVDYIKIFPIAGQTQIFKGEDVAKSGNYGIFTNNTPVTDRLQYGSDGNIYLWNNMTAATTTPYEGSEVLNYNIAAGNWWGMGIMANKPKNMSNYSDGYINMYMKTSSTATIGIGVASGAGESFIELVNGGEQYGLVRNGQWCRVRIPLNRFAVDFHSVHQMLMIKGDAPATAFTLGIDDVYWMESGPRPTPENGNFGVFTDNTPCVLKFNSPADGQFYVWANTLNPLTTTPQEGSNVLSFASASGLTWFGASFTPNTKYNLTAYRYSNSKLVFSMKTTSTVPFKIGIKSSNTPEVGQAWVTFRNGADPYGFVRDGQWRTVEIPMSVFDNVDLSQVSQLFTILGTEGAISNIAIDNIYFTGGGAAIKEGNQSPVCAITAPANNAIFTAPASIAIAATASDSDGSVSKVEFYNGATKLGEDVTSPYNYNWANVAAGTYSITVRATDNLGAVTTSPAVLVTVRAAPVVSTITITPATATINVGQTQQFTAVARDQYNNIITFTPAWSVSGSGNSINTSGLLTANTAGNYTVTCSSGSVQATAAVTINGGVEPNIALNKPATASSNEGGYAASACNDGSTTTRWSSLFADPQWVMIDLQANYNITRVVLNWETAAGRSFQIQVSADGATNWTNIYSTTTGTGGVQTLTVTGTGRFIRMYGTARTTVYGYSLWEFQVYGTESTVVPVTGVSVTPTSASLAVGATQQLSATIAPANATNKNVSWGSSNTAVATVNASGLVTAVAAGSATITVTTQDGARTATSAITVTNPGTLPSPWASANIGATGVAGSASYAGTTFTVAGSGADIWGTADAFRYVYQQITGDVTITARVVSLTNTDGWAKAGVMIRNGTGANVAHALTAVTIGNGLAFQRRTTAGGESSHTAGPAGTVPYWVRLQRVGNTITSFVSTNGTSWTTVGSQAITMASAVYVGLAVTSHNNTVLCTATFDNVSVTTSTIVAVTGVSVSPTAAALNIGGTQQLTATVAPTNATNKNVSWVSSNTAVAIVNASGLVTAVAAGSATITVTTQDGNRTASCAITVNPNNINIALNKPATSSSNEGGFVASACNDGSTATRWSSLFADPQWVMIDLQANYNISRVVLNWEAAAGRSFQIQVSSNGTSWTSIYSTTTGTGGINTLNVTGTGRYIRMYGTVRVTAYGYSLWEFEVYGNLVSQSGLAENTETAAEVAAISPAFKFFPNPVHEILTVQFGEAQYNALNVYDLTGKLVKQVQFELFTTEASVDMAGLNTGTYIVRITGAGAVNTFKILKK